MSIDQALEHLQADLRFALESPSGESKAALMEAIDSLLSEGVPTSGDSNHWWMSRLMSAVRTFAQFPTKQRYESIARMTSNYLNLVNHGFLTPIGISRSRTFDGRTEWFHQELDDRAYRFVSNPTADTKRVLEDQLAQYCRIKCVSLV
jgi:hypothetical protein